MKNIELFDKITGYIFGECYENFPVCLDIKAKLFLEKYELQNEKSGLILSETLFWLKENGFIDFKSPTQKTVSKMDGVIACPVFSCVVLTAKGLEVLKKVPKNINRNKNLGEEIIDAVKLGAKEKISELVGFGLSFAV